MKYILIFYICFISGANSHAFSANSKLEESNLIIATPVLCPYVCDSIAKDQGYIIDILNIVAKSNNFNIKIVFTNKHYARDLFTNSHVDMVLFSDRLFREKLSREEKIKVGKIKIGEVKPAIFSRTKKFNRFKRFKINERNLIFLTGNHHPLFGNFDPLDHWVGEKFEKELAAVNISGPDLNKTLTNLLYSENFTFIHDANIFNHQLSKLAYDLVVNFTQLEVLDKRQTAVYLLTNESMRTSDSLAAIISREILHLRRAGRLERILKNYRLSDWKKP